jgi:hypothetical protein
MPDNEEIINDLLNEFKGHRNAIMLMIADIEKLKAKIDTIIPEKLDARYVRFFEEKVKTATEFFKALLEMRKEIQKSLKDEIELRRKIDVKDRSMGIEDLIDIRKMADKVASFKKAKDKLTDKSVSEAQDATDKIADEVKKMNAM